MPRARLGIIILLILAASAALAAAPVRRAAPAVFAWVEAQGAIAPLIVCLFYFPCALLALPVAWLTMGAGAMFGPWRAFLLATISANLAANAAFALGRRVGRRRMESWFHKYPRLGALERAMAAKAFKIALLARLSPVSPYGVLNYTLSVMPIATRQFALATLIGKTPGNILYACLGAGARSAADAAAGGSDSGWGGTIVLAIGIVATLALVAVLARLARDALAGEENS